MKEIIGADSNPQYHLGLKIFQYLSLWLRQTVIFATSLLGKDMEYGKASLQRIHFLMHVKDPWIRSVLFALSGLMLAIGFIKMKDQVQSLMVIAVGLISLATVVSKDPNQDM